MKATQLTELVIIPALKKINLFTPQAAMLVLGTACVESQCGEYISQLGNGPALGIFQIEPATYNDLIDNYLAYRPELKAKLLALYCENLSASENLTCNLIYQAAVCRLVYYRSPQAIPTDLHGMADYWKKYYNTSKGKGTPEKFIAAYKRYANE